MYEASTTIPSAVLYIGVPIGAAKSVPKCPFNRPVTGCLRLLVNRDEIRVNETGAFKKIFLKLFPY